MGHYGSWLEPLIFAGSVSMTSILVSQFYRTRIICFHPNRYILHVLNRSLIDMSTAASSLLDY